MKPRAGYSRRCTKQTNPQLDLSRKMAKNKYGERNDRDKQGLKALNSQEAGTGNRTKTSKPL